LKELEAAFTAIKGRWMTGLEGLSAAPDQWQHQLGRGTEAELRLLALTGQALQVAFQPTPAEQLTPSTALPMLALPAMPDPARALFRRLLSQRHYPADSPAPVLALIAARGYSVHPLDWMPKTEDSDIPPLYAPWLDWLNSANGKHHEALTADNWDDWSPAARRRAFIGLRSRDAGAARQLLAAAAPGLAAEERRRLIELLGNKLSTDDIDYLETLSTDRSSKVRSTALQLLARLGATDTDTVLSQELADTLELKHADLNGRQKILTPKKLKNKAQRARRLELLTLLPLHSLAGAFEMSVEQTIERWDVSADSQLNTAFAAMVASTGSDQLPGLLAQRLIKTQDTAPIYQLISRLTAADKTVLLSDALALDGDNYQLASQLCLSAPGKLTFNELTRSADYNVLIQTIETQSCGDDNSDAAHVTGGCLLALGVLLEQSAAALFIEKVTAAGMLSVDPQLTTLQMNAALPPRS